MAWSKKGSTAVVTVPKTRAKMTTILGAISASGLIKCSLRLPQVSTRKRKRTNASEIISRGTVTGHYLSFLKATMDEMDKYQHMKGHYLVMDNAPILKPKIFLGILSLEDIDVLIFHHTRLNLILLNSFGPFSRVKLNATGSWKARR